MKQETKQQVSHTPGTWEVDFDTVQSFLITAPNVTVAMSNETDIDEGRLSIEEMQANGRLIAAAPEMLRCLHNCVEVLKAINHEYKVDFAATTLEESQAAINKATNQ